VISEAFVWVQGKRGLGHYEQGSGQLLPAIFYATNLLVVPKPQVRPGPTIINIVMFCFQIYIRDIGKLKMAKNWARQKIEHVSFQTLQ